jgi:hypothetical protein
MEDRKLPVLDIFQEALNLPAKHFSQLLKVGFPLIALVAIFVVYQRLIQVEPSGTQFPLSMFLFGIGLVLTLVMAIVGCHRIFLMDSKVTESASVFNWTGNEVKYIGWWIVIGLAALVVALPFLLVIVPWFSSQADEAGLSKLFLTIVLVFFNVCVGYFVSRWSLVLPSCAIDKHGHSINWSWKLSRGNGWRLTILIAGFPVLVDTVFELLPAIDSIVYYLLLTIFWLAFGIVQIGLLSLSYAFLSDPDYVQVNDVPH